MRVCFNQTSLEGTIFTKPSKPSRVLLRCWHDVAWCQTRVGNHRTTGGYCCWEHRKMSGKSMKSCQKWEKHLQTSGISHCYSLIFSGGYSIDVMFPPGNSKSNGGSFYEGNGRMFKSETLIYIYIYTVIVLWFENLGQHLNHWFAARILPVMG